MVLAGVYRVWNRMLIPVRARLILLYGPSSPQCIFSKFLQMVQGVMLETETISVLNPVLSVLSGKTTVTYTYTNTFKGCQ